MNTLTVGDLKKAQAAAYMREYRAKHKKPGSGRKPPPTLTPEELVAKAEARREYLRLAAVRYRAKLTPEQRAEHNRRNREAYHALRAKYKEALLILAEQEDARG